MSTCVAFYTQVLRFGVTRHGPDHVSVRNRAVVLGLGPAAKLPEPGDSPGLTRQRLNAAKGAGVEIVLELDGVDELEGAERRRCGRRPRTGCLDGAQRPAGPPDGVDDGLIAAVPITTVLTALAACRIRATDPMSARRSPSGRTRNRPL
jgi:hypothetical protein